MNSFEWTLAWRMISARRKQLGVNIISLLAVLGIALSVAALITTLSVREGFRTEFVSTFLQSNPHITITSRERILDDGRSLSVFPDSFELDDWNSAGIVRGQVMAKANGDSGVDVIGIKPEHASLYGLSTFDDGAYVGQDLAETLGVQAGDTLQLISPNGVKTAFGTSPRITTFLVKSVFSSGRYDVDRSRIYLPLNDAQAFFNREGLIDAVHIFLNNPEDVDLAMTDLAQIQALGGSKMWSWKDTAGNFLKALELEDRVMFILLAALVSIASTTILASLFVLARTKKSSIGILRTLGLSKIGVARVFFICGMLLGLTGTLLGAAMGSWMSLNVDTLLTLAGGDWDPSVRGIYTLPVALTPDIILTSASMALGLSMVSTLIPAVMAAHMAPVEALHG